LIDNEHGRNAAAHIITQALRHNSVDLAEVEVDLEIQEVGEDGLRLMFNYTKWKIAATTLVGVPAFADARAELGEEITAALEADTPLVVNVNSHALSIEVAEDEVLAEGGIVQPWEAFHQPEPDEPQKLRVEANRWVSGHLALWESCHDGFENRCLTVPRPTDNYASFNKAGVLTDRGLVETGPIFLAGGHRRVTDGDFDSAYGGTENAWADVRVTPGVHGPWLSGIVRPGVSDERVYAARASRISGHWRGGRLKAIVSVNSEGFDVPGSGFASAGFAFSTDDSDRVVELVASMPLCFEEKVAPDDAAVKSWLFDWARQQMAASIEGEDVELDDDITAEALAAILDLDDDD
jgi:hypothetical protein